MKRSDLHPDNVTVLLDFGELDEGYQFSGRAFAIARWRERKERAEFQRLVWRIQARKYWASKDPAKKARIYEYRRRWAKDHPERVKQSADKARKKRRGNPVTRERELAQKRAREAVERQERRGRTVYTCEVCGTQWTPLGRLPSRPPKYCLPNGWSCRSKAAYLRRKHNAAWRDYLPEQVWP